MTTGFVDRPGMRQLCKYAAGLFIHNSKLIIFSAIRYGICQSARAYKCGVLSLVFIIVTASSPSKCLLPSSAIVLIIDRNANHHICTKKENAPVFCIAIILPFERIGSPRRRPDATELPSHSISTLDE